MKKSEKPSAKPSSAKEDQFNKAKKARERPSRRSWKREELIDGATALFNARGISATSVSVVAEVLNLSRATIYYYVKNRSELVFQCYMRACELAADDLAKASQAETGFDSIIEYIRLALTPDRPPVAVLSEINSLDSDIASLIRRANNRNTKALISLIERGIEDRSINDCDSELAAQSIIGMLAWSQLLPHWSNEHSGQALRGRAAEAMIDMLSFGLATDRAVEFDYSISAEVFQPILGNIFNRKESSAFKIEKVLATASALFNRNGIEATSLDEIAAAMGLTKGAVYHYLDDKPDLVIHCYERSFELYDKFVEVAEERGGNGLEAAMINAHLNIQAQAGTLCPLMPQPGFDALPKPHRDEFHRRASNQNSAVASLIQRGVDEGIARGCEAALVTHICAGAFGWIPKWRPKDDARSPKEVADRICTIIVRGLKRS